LLLDPALADTAVLINELGEIGLDHHLLERIVVLPEPRNPVIGVTGVRSATASANLVLHARN
jgi:hypothetical protein